jgi:hypothetical protein
MGGVEYQKPYPWVPVAQSKPTTPSVFGRDDSGAIFPILAAMIPLYHEALEEEAAEARIRAEAENTGRLRLPVIRREERQRGSVSAIVSNVGSDMGFEENGTVEESRGRDGNGGRVQYSTRTSSGFFPEP